MSNRITARLLGISVSATVLLSLLATPAAAVSHTARWVDDDASAGGGPQECATAGYTSIQAAIDDSSAGDRVFVCPGTYVETLTIPTGVKVKARPLFLARIAAPLAGPAHVVSMTGDNTRLRGFIIEIPAGAYFPNARPDFEACHKYDAAIMVTGNNAEVRNNRISSVGGATLAGACGYDYGIVVGQHGDSATARVTFNWVTDFKRGGILVEDADSYAYVRRNTVRYLHESECLIVSLSCTVSTVGVRSAINEAFPLAFGIGVESEARADILRNWIGSGPNACTTPTFLACTGITPATPLLEQGISLVGLDGTETTTVRNNVVRITAFGIITNEAADGAVLSYNDVQGSAYGLYIGGDNDTWHHNVATANGVGAYAAGHTNLIHDNTLTGNVLFDCTDATSGALTAGTDNTWLDNLGDIDLPDVCEAS